ncbi:MAG: site-specific integrase, partial [bacterium]
MSDKKLIGPWIRRFLMEHLVGERNLSRNTQASYRDAIILLLPFVAKKAGKPIERLSVDDISPEVVRIFPLHLEEDRGCSVATRNGRLAAIRALARFIAMRGPEHVAWCAEIRTIPLKKTSRPAMAYLDKPEMDALLDAPNRRSAQGFRDHALLLFLYNTG